jgi:CBS domain-containing protein
MPEKRIKDLMLDPASFDRIFFHTKVSEAVRMIDEKKRSRSPSFLLVVDEAENKEEILGMLSMNDVLYHMGSSAQSMEELPIFWRGQFQEECEALLKSTTGEIMSPVTLVIDQNGTLMEAVHLVNSEMIDWLPVVEGEDVVGILLKEDLFREVLVATESEKGS